MLTISIPISYFFPIFAEVFQRVTALALNQNEKRKKSMGQKDE